MAGRVLDDGGLAGVEVGAAPVGDAVLSERHLRDDHVLPRLTLVPGDDRVVPDLAVHVREAGVDDAGLREDDRPVARDAGVVGVVVALVVGELFLRPRLAEVV